MTTRTLAVTSARWNISSTYRAPAVSRSFSGQIPRSWSSSALRVIQRLSLIPKGCAGQTHNWNNKVNICCWLWDTIFIWSLTWQIN